MCGIAGIITAKNRDLRESIRRVHSVQGHRGPDATGESILRMHQWRVALIHQRLAIIDLSDAASQPMGTGPRRLIFNGEIYNYLELRDELLRDGCTFQTKSDTEVLLVSLEHWGIDRTLSRLNGMWAFAWVDQTDGRLILARDRAGEKPLHYFISANELFFASEIKAILTLGETRFDLNHAVVADFLNQSLLDTSDETFFAGIKRLPAAHYAVFDLKAPSFEPAIVRYWEPPIIKAPIHDTPEPNQIDCVRETFIDSVRLRLRSDVPLGVLLSGGIDSSSIAAAMQSIFGKGSDLNLISAVSRDARYDESPFINLVARHLGRTVHKVVLDDDPHNLFALLPQVCWANDEPIGSFSTVAHYLLMQRAQEIGVTVILSGQGADELLCGYRKYFFFYIEKLMREGHILTALSLLRSFYERRTILSQFSLAEAKRYLPAMFYGREAGIAGRLLRRKARTRVGLGKSSVQERQRADFERFSIPVLTHYEDRMSMAWSREVRLPFLDNRLVELLLPMKPSMKLRNGWTKYVFRRAMQGLVPAEVIWRKDKQGFVNPQSEWLKYDLAAKVLQTFAEDSLMFRSGLVDRVKLLKMYSAYRRDRKLGSCSFKDIFNPLIFEIFLRRFETYLRLPLSVGCDYAVDAA